MLEKKLCNFFVRNFATRGPVETKIFDVINFKFEVFMILLLLTFVAKTD